MNRFTPRVVALFLALAGLALGACADTPPCPAATLPPTGDEARWAVVTSDYLSTAVGLLGADGTVLDEAWVDSGSAPAGIIATLSGDVALPSTPTGPGELTVIDRFGVDVVSRFDLRGGAVISQARAQLGADAGGGGFRSNPQDARVADSGALFVSRFEANLDPEAPDLDRGNDLVELDAHGPVRRIDFSALDVEVDGATVYARPGRIARLGDSWVVGLGRLDADFMTSGPGAVAILDAGGDGASLRAVNLPGLSNCAEVRESPSGDRVFVVCAGDTFVDTEGRRARAGVGRLTLVDAAPTIDGLYRATDDPGGPVPTSAPIPLDDARVVVVSGGDASDVDALYTLDLDTLAYERWYEAGQSFALGVGAFDPAGGLLLVPDAGRGVLRFRPRGLTATDEGVVEVSACRGLPAREIAPLAP